MKKISILGMGRWASCIAYMLNQSKHNLTMWEKAEFESQLFKTHKNEFLTLPQNIKFTHNLNDAIQSAEVVVIAILSQNLQDLTQQLKQVDGYNKKRYCINMKGIEASTGRRLTEILIDAGIPKQNIAVWVGPGHVQSIANGGVTNMIISSYNHDYARELAREFASATVAITASDDILGTELGAACKNVYGIAAGVLQANPKYSHCIGSLMVASVKELSLFIQALGGNTATASGLALLGDYQATMFDEYSKNLTYGKSIVKYNSISLNNLAFDQRSAEGIKTAEAMLKLKERHTSQVGDIQLPIIQAVNQIVTGKIELSTAPEYLFKIISRVLEK